MRHTTDYREAFIEVAADSPATRGTVPPASDPPTIAGLHHELLAEPYARTSDEALVETLVRRRGADRAVVEAEFFAKGQPCLRSSPLGKRYGWGLHFDHDGRVALYGVETAEYARLAADPSLTHLTAMRSKRA